MPQESGGRRLRERLVCYLRLPLCLAEDRRGDGSESVSLAVESCGAWRLRVKDLQTKQMYEVATELIVRTNEMHHVVLVMKM